MITIYFSEGITHQPYNIPTGCIEEHRERQFAINLMQCIALEFVELMMSPVQLVVFYAILLWPEIIFK